jgi:hypothetical protein
MVAAALLAIAGGAKAIRPDDTVGALRAARLPSARWIVRAGAVAEGALGLYAIVAGDRLAAALVAGSYLAFASFVLVALRSGAPIASCGCFGREDTPPSLVHVGMNVGLATAAGAVAVWPGVGIARVLENQPLAGVPYLLLVAVGVYAAFLALTVLPRVLALVTEMRTS